MSSPTARLFVYGCLVFVAPFYSSDGRTQTAQSPERDLTSQAIKAHVEFLADDLLEGRGAGSRGHALAAGYVAAQFQQLGLKPLGDRGSFFQSVPLLEATPVLPGSAAKLLREGESIDFEYGTDYLPTADFSAPTSSLTAPLAFAGFGVTAPEADYDDFAGVDAQGRIVVIFGGAPAKFPNDQRAYYSWQGSKYPNLIAHGAVGVITIDTPSDAERTPWERRVNASGQPQMRWLDGGNQPADSYGELKQRFRFNRDAAVKLLRNTPHTLDEMFAVANASQPQGFALTGMLTLSATTGLRRTESSNVIAVLEGSDPKLKNEFIVFTAHLDHLGRGKAVNGDSIYNGAHDNALGSAVLLEAARSLASGTVRPKRSILFVSVTAEERGLLGSDFFANHPTVPKDAIVANLNIDMPLPLAPTRDLVAFGAEHSSLGAVVLRGAQLQNFTISPDNEPEEVHFIRSDQFSFVRRGIPALSLIIGYTARSRGIDVGALRRDFLRNHYHQPSDDLSLPIDYNGAAGLTRVYVSVALDVANQAAKPRWHRADFFGNKFGNPQYSATTNR